MFRRDKNVDLKLGVKRLCSGHKISSLKVVFDFLSAKSTGKPNVRSVTEMVNFSKL